MKTRLGFFCELPAADAERLLTDDATLAALRQLDATVSLGLIDLTDERARAVQALNRAAIPVTAWLLLPESAGYWTNISNPDEAWARYGDFREWSGRHALHWAGVGIDIEPRIQDLRALRTARWRLVGTLMPRLVMAGRLEQARALYQGLIGLIRTDGFAVDAYVVPLLQTERRAGTRTLQRLSGILDLRVEREIAMLYTNFIRPHGPGFLDHFAPHFDAVAVGVTGGGVQDGIDPPPDLTWDEFARDLRIARRHTDDIHIFSLEGCVAQGWLQNLITFDWSVPVDVPPAARRAAERFDRIAGVSLRLLARPVLGSLVAGTVAAVVGARFARRR